MVIKYSQISLKDTFVECQDFFIDNTPSLFNLLREHVDLNEFYSASYLSVGRKRKYPLSGFLSALILQKIISIPTYTLLILFLSISNEFRDFYVFKKVPDAPLFLLDLNKIFFLAFS